MRKLLFYLSNNDLTVYGWDRKQLARQGVFRNDESGWKEFADFLESHATTPAYLLADIIEEDFQRDTLPHVIGKTHQNLIKRRMGQLYRDTPYRQATFQGREKTGRKDDQFLFSALTNAELLKPWLDAVADKKAPLAGIYSVALLGPRLFRRFASEAAHVLVVTHQSCGLRQSYFRDGQLRFSRLTLLSDHSPESVAAAFESETAKIRQFLVSTRMLTRDDTVQIVAIADGGRLAEMERLTDSGLNVRYEFVDLDALRAATGNVAGGEAEQCSSLYLALLAKTRIPDQYPVSRVNRYFSLWRVRIALYAASAVTVLGAVGLTAANVLDIHNLRRETADFESQIATIESQYRVIVGNMPATDVSPHDMKTVVDVERTISQNGPSPLLLIRIAGAALDEVPQARTKRIEWHAVAAPEDGSPVDTATLAAPEQTDESAGLPPAETIGLPKAPMQVLVLEGEITDFRQDYRLALDSVRKLADALNRNDKVRAEVVREPLDLRPTVSLQGKTGSGPAEAKAEFTIKVMWTP